MARIKIEITSQDQGEGRTILLGEIVGRLTGMRGLRWPADAGYSKGHFVWVEFDVKEYFGKGE